MIKWENKFSVKYEEIDNQHKKLIEIIIDLASAIKSKATDFSTTLSILNELDSYVTEHFAFEEELMEKHNYENIESHMKAHKIFRDKVTNLNVFNINKDERIEFLNDMLVYTVNWLSEHIMRIDSQLGEFLSKQEIEV